MRNKNLYFIIGGLAIVIGLLVAIIFILLNKNSSSENNSSTTTITTETLTTTTTAKPPIAIGTYYSNNYNSKMKLNLNDDKSFDAEVNLCEVIGEIIGTYTYDNDYVYLSFEAGQFQGFDGDDRTSFKFKIVDFKTLKFVDSDMSCGPFKNDVYKLK